MIIAIDLDNTIIDEFGSTLRPGIIEFLDILFKKHSLILWTNSKKIRAYEIIKYFNLRKYFTRMICREDYDPDDIGERKDLRKIDGNIIIDDDPDEIQYNKKNKKIAILVKPYRKNSNISGKELENILKTYKLD